ncbi:MAG: radical SAM protein [Oscillospiraceae bacterium]|nr:radical SAM protein [Oscillospiraceae bacterium]
MHFQKVSGILSAGNGINLYRGCTHGCIYCDSRSKCYGMEHDFTDIAVKENALTLLESALQKKRRRCMIATGSMCDPYMPAERELQYTRKALALIAQYGFGWTVITKSDLILRDFELMQRIHTQTKCVVQMTLTTADDSLCRILEPHVCPTSRRAEVLRIFRDAGIPTVVWLCPILPFINDTAENISAILEMCADAGVYGVVCFDMGLTLREGNREYFYDALDRFFPDLKQQYIRRYGNAYIVNSPNHIKLMQLFHETCEKYRIVHDNDAIFRYLSEFEDRTEGEQLRLF